MNLGAWKRGEADRPHLISTSNLPSLVVPYPKNSKCAASQGNH
jgi:hypothetical protein